MAKYYQHIDSSDESFFGMVTTLEYIDNDDPDFILYYFTDGTKCGEQFVGKLNQFDAFGKCVMAEVDSPANAWKFNKIEIVDGPKKARSKSGEIFEAPELPGSNKNAKANIHIDAIHPRFSKKEVEPIDKYYSSTVYSQEIDNSADAEVVSTTDISAVEMKDKNLEMSSSNIISTENLNKNILSKSSSKSGKLTLNLNNLFEKNTVIEIVIDGRSYDIHNMKEFYGLYDSMNTTQKITDDEYFDLEKDMRNTKDWQLLDNMIEMCNQEESIVGLELELSVPPVDVYSIIKKVYKKGMVDNFIKILVNRMSNKQLKNALCDGLSNYYNMLENGEYEENDITETIKNSNDKLIESQEKEQEEKNPYENPFFNKPSISKSFENLLNNPLVPDNSIKEINEIEEES